ncbi:hypothetical protein WJT86_10900 [Microvirga sp. W0021]|uniref:Lipoprotein SmpA/OmlA domain-containing protein n=1 Tax=Hohaiivirga grylli TaxID=3133970 RepID=A0ABV0BLA7_9HYPH
MKSIHLLVLMLAATLAGCASSGNEAIRGETVHTLDSKIVKGRTTKADVRAQIGDPSSVSFTDAGNEIWTYTHEVATAKVENFVPVVNYFTRGADVKSKSVVILFDSRGVVKNYTLSDAQNERRWGVGAN